MTSGPKSKGASSGRFARWGIVATLVAALGAAVLVLPSVDTPPESGADTDAGDDAFVAAAETDDDSTVPLCGYPTPAVVASDGAPEGSLPKPTVIESQVPRLVDIDSTGSDIAMLSLSSDGRFEVIYADATGTRASFSAALEPRADGQPNEPTTLVVDNDQFVYLIDRADTGDSIVKFGPDGSGVWERRYGDEASWTGIRTIYGVSTASSVRSVVAVLSDGRHVGLSPDGDWSTESATLSGDSFSGQPSGHVVTVSSGSSKVIRLYDQQGQLVTELAESDDAEPGAPPVGLGLRSPEAVVLDTGDVLVADDGLGLALLDTAGPLKGLVPERADGPLPDILPGSPIAVLGDGVVLGVTSEAEGAADVVVIDAATLKAYLDAPMHYDEGTAQRFAQLGVGGGLRSAAPFNYFRPGDDVSIWAEFAPSWGSLSETHELHYTVRSDPSVEPKDGWPQWVARIPPGGSRVSLAVPDADVGVYQVDAHLVDTRTGSAVSGTCLVYAIGPSDSTADFSSLPPGSDWGGPRPLRGVELAAQLGMPVYRVQLDFGRLVTRPTDTPDQDEIVWDSLPRADEDADPFAELAAAAAYAAEHDVTVVVQVAQGEEAAVEAVRTGTWAGWVEAIARELGRRAPDLTTWAPWNEPNNTGFPDGQDYATSVLAPFASAVRSASDDSVVVAGSTLGVSPEWWRAAIDAGACADLDVIDIHPYTGYNRSWEEEGLVGPDGTLRELESIAAECGAEQSIWATEFAWWSDGPANFYSQANDVSRALSWMRYHGIDKWAYFITEGGWGENGQSWSLIQYESYPKPAAVAHENAARLLADRPKPEVEEVDIPFAHVLKFDAPTGGGESTLAAWTEEFATPALLTTAGSESVSVTEIDQYGRTRVLQVGPGEPARVDLSDRVLFYLYEPTASVTLQPTEPFGPSVLLGSSASASSSTSDSSPSSVLRDDASNQQPWRSGPAGPDGNPDLEPWLLVELDEATTIDRIGVATASIRCCTAGLRDYDISVHTADDEWRVVGRVRDQFHERVIMTSFEPLTVDAIRIDIPSRSESGVSVVSSNYSGMIGGLHPDWIRLEPRSDGIAAVSAIVAYAPAQM